IAVAAGFGAAGLFRRCRWAHVRIMIWLVTLGLVNFEALRAPLGYEPFSSIPHVYDLLARQAVGAIVELPLAPPVDFFLNAPYMLASTRHWRPMLNGYSGFRPGSYDEMFFAIQTFPSVKSLLELKARGVTDIVVHTGMVPHDTLEAARHIGS